MERKVSSNLGRVDGTGIPESGYGSGCGCEFAATAEGVYRGLVLLVTAKRPRTPILLGCRTKKAKINKIEC